MLTEHQQRQIVESVTAGKTWPRAFELAGIGLDEMLTVVSAGKRVGGCPDCQAFVKRLEGAGRQATEASLKQHTRGQIHA